jgi:hypothetical protein
MHWLQIVCEYDYELLNFATNFGTKFATFRENLHEINSKSIIKTYKGSVAWYSLFKFHPEITVNS